MARPVRAFQSRVTLPPMHRNNPMTQDEYDAVKAASPAQSFSGTIEAYWCPGFHAPTHYHERRKALRLDGGGMLEFDLKLRVGDASCAPLQEGTKVSIEVPVGTTPPLNCFCEHPMSFRALPDDDVLWCREHPDMPEPRDEKGRFHYDEYGYEHWISSENDEEKQNDD